MSLDPETSGIETYILKVASNCNFNCSYCNIYNAADDTFALQPRRMARETMQLLAERIEAHRRGSFVQLVLHGGEPLLLGQECLSYLCETLARVLQRNYQVALQTNGVLLTSEWVALLDHHHVQVGVSIDGPAAIHDRFRRDRAGRATHQQVERAIQLLNSSEAGRRIFGGTISVIHLDFAPERLYSYLRGLGINRFNLLLPDSNWQAPPPLPADRQAEDYGAYLSRIFDCWLAEDNADVRIDLLWMPLRLLLGAQVGDEFWGMQPLRVAIVETDGGLEIHDAFRTCANGLTKQGLNLYQHSFDDLLASPRMRWQLEPRELLCQTCRNCSWLEICGGGMPAHRYRNDNLIDNPSVYCRDIQRLLEHMSAVLSRKLASTF